MPYKLVKVKDGYKVKSEHSGRFLSRHPLTKEMATKQMRAVYAKEKKGHFMEGAGKITVVHYGKTHEIFDGAGFFSDIFGKIKAAAKAGINALKAKVDNPRYDYPPKVRDYLQKNASGKINSIQIRRAPVESGIEKFLNLLSLGQLEKAKKKYAYDKLYHLSMIIGFTINGQQKYMIAERNEVINIGDSFAADNSTEYITVPIYKDITVGELFDNALKLEGRNLFIYDAFNNNCQKFIKSVLDANGLSTNESNNFILQDVSGIQSELPGFVAPVAKGITDVAAAVNRIIEGEGKPRIDFEKIKWGTFTKQFERFQKKHKDIKDINEFADYVIAHKDDFQKTTVRRARFYKNILKKHKINGGALFTNPRVAWQAQNIRNENIAAPEVQKKYQERYEGVLKPAMDIAAKIGATGVLGPVGTAAAQAYNYATKLGQVLPVVGAVAGGGPMSSGVRKINRGMKGKMLPLAVNVADAIISNRSNPIGMFNALVDTATQAAHGGAVMKTALGGMKDYADMCGGRLPSEEELLEQERNERRELARARNDWGARVYYHLMRQARDNNWNGIDLREAINNLVGTDDDMFDLIAGMFWDDGVRLHSRRGVFEQIHNHYMNDDENSDESMNESDENMNESDESMSENEEWYGSEEAQRADEMRQRITQRQQAEQEDIGEPGDVQSRTRSRASTAENPEGMGKKKKRKIKGGVRHMPNDEENDINDMIEFSDNVNSFVQQIIPVQFRLWIRQNNPVSDVAGYTNYLIDNGDILTGMVQREYYPNLSYDDVRGALQNLINYNLNWVQNYRQRQEQQQRQQDLQEEREQQEAQQEEEAIGEPGNIQSPLRSRASTAENPEGMGKKKKRKIKGGVRQRAQLAIRTPSVENITQESLARNLNRIIERLNPDRLQRWRENNDLTSYNNFVISRFGLLIPTLMSDYPTFTVSSIRDALNELINNNNIIIQAQQQQQQEQDLEDEQQTQEAQAEEEAIGEPRSRAASSSSNENPRSRASTAENPEGMGKKRRGRPRKMKGGMDVQRTPPRTPRARTPRTPRARAQAPTLRERRGLAPLAIQIPPPIVGDLLGLNPFPQINPNAQQRAHQRRVGRDIITPTREREFQRELNALDEENIRRAATPVLRQRRTQQQTPNGVPAFENVPRPASPEGMGKKRRGRPRKMDGKGTTSSRPVAQTETKILVNPDNSMALLTPAPEVKKVSRRKYKYDKPHPNTPSEVNVEIVPTEAKKETGKTYHHMPITENIVKRGRGRPRKAVGGKMERRLSPMREQRDNALTTEAEENAQRTMAVRRQREEEDADRARRVVRRLVERGDIPPPPNPGALFGNETPPRGRTVATPQAPRRGRPRGTVRARSPIVERNLRQEIRAAEQVPEGAIETPPRRRRRTEGGAKEGRQRKSKSTGVSKKNKTSSK